MIDGNVMDELFDRLLQQYQKQSKKFSNFYIGLNCFAILFFFLIFIPYASIEQEKQTQAEKLQILSRMKTLIYSQSHLIEIMGNVQEDFLKPLPVKSFDEIKEAWREFGMIMPYDRNLAADILENVQGNSSGWQKSYRAQQSVLLRFQEYQYQLKENVIVSLENVIVSLSDEKNQFDQKVIGRVKELEKTLQLLGAKIREEIQTEPFILDKDSDYVVLTAEFRSNIRQEAVTFLTSLYGILADTWWNDTLELEWKKYRDIENVEYSQTQIISAIEELDKKKKEILGQLPQVLEVLGGGLSIRPHEAMIYLFPAILGFVFLFCSFLYLDSMYLQKKLYQTKSTEIEPGKHVLTEKYLTVITPLLLSSNLSTQKKLFQVILLVLPFTTYCLSIGLLLSILKRPIDFQWIYISLYLASFGAFLLGGVQFGKGLHVKNSEYKTDFEAKTIL